MTIEQVFIGAFGQGFTQHQMVYESDSGSYAALDKNAAAPEGHRLLSLDELTTIIYNRMAQLSQQREGYLSVRPLSERIEYLINRQIDHFNHQDFLMKIVAVICILLERFKSYLEGRGFSTTLERMQGLHANLNTYGNVDPTNRARTRTLGGFFGGGSKVNVYNDTLRICAAGRYQSGGKTYIVDHGPMLARTFCYGDNLPQGDKLAEYSTTRIKVVEGDTLDVLCDYARQGHRACGINFANAEQPGGAVGFGASAQEEEICRRSNHILGLTIDRTWYPFSESGGIYSPHVQVFKKGAADQYALMDEVVEVALLAIAAFNLGDPRQRADLGFPTSDEISEEALRDHVNCGFVDGTKAKIRNALRVMGQQGHTHLVLGALGCGAFQNPPGLIAELFKEVLGEFTCFEEVTFAILKLSAKDAANIAAFQKCFPESPIEAE